MRKFIMFLILFLLPLTLFSQGGFGSGFLTPRARFQEIVIGGSILPDAADGATIGSATLEWSDVYLADGSIIYFGADQDVTLTHVADAGLLLNTTMYLSFRDNALKINSSADGQLDIDADTEVEITTTTVDLNGALDVSGQITGATGRSATLTVATSTSSTLAKAQADYLCDGTADDVEIQAALTALPAAGGTVLLFEGTYNITAAVVMPTLSKLIGQGNGTILYLVSGSDCSVIEAGASAHYVEIAYLAIDGNGTNQTANNYLIYLATAGTVQYASVHHCFVHDSRQNQGINFNAGSHNVCSNNIVKNAGIRMGNGTFVCSDNYIYNLPPVVGVDAALIITGGVYSTVNGNVVWAASKTGNVGILVSAGHGVSVTGNTVITTGTHGIEINNADRCVVTGNVVEGAGSTNSHGGINVNSTSTENLIEGNWIKDSIVGIRVASDNNSIIDNYIYDSGIDTMQIGIKLDTGSAESMVRGNTIRDATQNGINVLASSDRSTISGNFVADTDVGGTTYSGIYVIACSEMNINDNHVEASGLHGIEILRSSYATLTGNVCNNQTTGDGINVTGDATGNSDYNNITGNSCYGNGDDGIAIEGTTDANQNIVSNNKVVGNSGTALVNNGTGTMIMSDATAGTWNLGTANVQMIGNLGVGSTAQHDGSFYSATPWIVLTDTDTNLDISSAAEAIDTAAVYIEADGTPSFGLRGTDGDAMEITLNTSDAMLFSNAGGGYIHDGNVLANTSNYVMEGYATGRNVLRAATFVIEPGGTPNTDINCSALSSDYGFNTPTLTAATNLTAGTSGGVFGFAADGTNIKVEITEDIVGVISCSIVTHDINSSSQSEMYTVKVRAVSTFLYLYIIQRGTTASLDWRTVMDAGDKVEILVSFITSS